MGQRQPADDYMFNMDSLFAGNFRFSATLNTLLCFFLRNRCA